MSVAMSDLSHLKNTVGQQEAYVEEQKNARKS